MVYGLLLFGVGIVGFGLAGYWDLKTTEFPDWLPYSMIVLALLIRGATAALLSDFSIILSALMIGGAFFLVGQLLYALKQWGDGDAWLLGAFGVLFPDSAGFPVAAAFPFPIVVLFNFFTIAFVYLLAYALILGLKERRKIGRKLKKELRKRKGTIMIEVAAFTLAYSMVVAYFSVLIDSYSLLLLTPLFSLLLLGAILFLHYGKILEDSLLRRQVQKRELRQGDVLTSNRWRGLTKKEVALLRKESGAVWIKEGVRFAPVFLLTMLVSLLYGNLLFVLPF